PAPLQRARRSQAHVGAGDPAREAREEAGRDDAPADRQARARPLVPSAGADRRDAGPRPRALGKEASTVRTLRSLSATSFFLLVSAIGPGSVAAAPEGQMTWGVHISLAPTWFDPAETPGIGTPFMILYALHDALVKPMPGHAMTPSLAESWSVSKDGLVYDFVLRQGARFHNGDPVTADDVKFSFERYRGAAAKLRKERVAGVEAADPARGRFRLKEPWPDFMTYYGSLATGAGWIVPRKYLEKVGDEGFKRAPIGAGPYRFASF